MAKNSTVEQNNVEVVELFIIETLLKKRKIVVPDFGYLELISLEDRFAVLFKSSDENSSSYQRIMSELVDESDINKLYTLISVPLKEGKTVNLPQIGNFRPDKDEDGKMRVSFIPSIYLRKILKERENAGIGFKGVNEGVKEVSEKKTQNTPEKNFVEQKNNNSYRENNTQASDILVKQKRISTSHKTRNISGILLLFVAVIAILVVIAGIFPQKNKKVEDRVELAQPDVESINLTALAEQHYGHPAFWIYIFRANSDKLDSPVNIPDNISLVIPDLETEFEVDVTDSLEIIRANILADITLTQIKTK